MSARTSFFILMVASSVSPSLSRTLLSAPLLPSSRLFVSLVSCAGDSTVAFYLGPVPTPLRPHPSSSRYHRFFFFFFFFLLLAPGSIASFYLGANVLIACGRSSRSTLFLPSSTSPWLFHRHQPPKPFTVSSLRVELLIAFVMRRSLLIK